MTRTRPVDAAIYATLVAFVMGDLLPFPTVVTAAGVGVACGIYALRRDLMARMLFAIFLGMVLGILGVLLAAFAHR